MKPVLIALFPKGGGREEAGTQRRLEGEIRERVSEITSPHVSSGGQDAGSSQQQSGCPGGKAEESIITPGRDSETPALSAKGTLHTWLRERSGA